MQALRVCQIPVPGWTPVVLLTIETPVRATEVEERAVAAAKRFFPDATGSIGADRHLRLQTRDPLPLRNRIWELRIIDTFRGQVLHGVTRDGRSAWFRLSKQAALEGKLSFPPTVHGLGDLAITVDVEDDDPWPDAEAFAWWLCPETKDGEIVGPTD